MTRSRGSSLPRFTCLARASSGPPKDAIRRFSRRSATRSAIAAAFERNSSEWGAMALARMGKGHLGSTRPATLAEARVGLNRSVEPGEQARERLDARPHVRGARVFVGMVADPAAAAHEQHDHGSEGRERLRVVTGA